MSTFDDVMREIEATRRLLAEKKAGDARLAAVEAAVNRISAQLGRPGGFNSEVDGRASATAWLSCKHLAEQHRRGTLQPFVPSGEMIDAAVADRKSVV